MCVYLCAYICVFAKNDKIDDMVKNVVAAEGAFKKLKPEPNSGLSSLSGGVSSPGSGISSLPQHAGHTPTTASCPTPARRRHRTTFTQVPADHFIQFPIFRKKNSASHILMQIYRNCPFILKLDNYSVICLES